VRWALESSTGVTDAIHRLGRRPDHLASWSHLELGRRRPSDLVPSCDGVVTRDRGVSTCTSTTTATSLSDTVVASRVDPGPQAGLSQHTSGWSRTETVVETTTVRSRRGSGPVVATTDERTVSSVVQPLSATASSPSRGRPPSGTSRRLRRVRGTGPVRVSDRHPRPCLGRRPGHVLRRAGQRAWHEDVHGAVRPVRPGRDHGRSGHRPVPRSVHHHLLHRNLSHQDRRGGHHDHRSEGARTGRTRTSERVLSSTVEPVACHAWTAALRGGTGPSGLQDLTDCRDLGLFPA
jgi:hypothetical protein